jgi:threonine dehydratase
MLTIESILHAQQRLAPHLRPSPLVHSSYLSQRTGADVWLKLECHQPTGSFKVRGALNKLSQLSAEEKARGLVVASAGNHALGVAFAVQTLGGLTADMFVPENAPAAKVDKLRRFPIRLHQVGQSYQAAVEAAAAFAQKTGAVTIPAYDDLDVIAGQGTVGLEILSERPSTDLILVPIGGGGLIAGIATAAHALKPTCRVVGLQPEASPAALLSLRDGYAYEEYDHAPTLADGLAGGFGRLPFEVARNLISDILLASEAELRHAIYTLLDQEQLVVEASGAIAIAPLLNGRLDVIGQTIVCVLTGRNLATTLLKAILLEIGD